MGPEGTASATSTGCAAGKSSRKHSCLRQRRLHFVFHSTDGAAARRLGRNGNAFREDEIGREPEQDANRVRAAREAIGREIQLFVDANGAYDRKQSLAMADEFVNEGVTWFE